jgi:hypothetical protein
MTAINLSRETAKVGLSTILIQSVDFCYLRPMQKDPVHSASFSGAILDTSTGGQLMRTIHGWVQGIRGGQFFILSGAYCRSCQYSMACRFQYHPSWARAYGLPLGSVKKYMVHVYLSSSGHLWPIFNRETLKIVQLFLLFLSFRSTKSSLNLSVFMYHVFLYEPLARTFRQIRKQKASHD